MNCTDESSESNAAGGRLCELEVTVCTGFETTAKEEIEETVTSASDVTAARGRVNMLLPVDCAKSVRYVCNLSHLNDRWMLQVRSPCPLFSIL